MSQSGETVGEMHHGSLADFREKHVKENAFLPRNHLKKWSKAEKDKLHELILKDKSIPDIASTLGRSRLSIVSKSAAILGVNMDHIKIKDRLMKQTIKELLQTIKTESDEIAAKFGKQT